MKSTDAVIEIRGLHKKYGATDAVNGLDLTVRAGKCYGFFGRNGSGKTTTIKCLLNLLRPSEGTVRVFGCDPSKREVEMVLSGAGPEVMERLRGYAMESLNVEALSLEEIFVASLK